MLTEKANLLKCRENIYLYIYLHSTLICYARLDVELSLIINWVLGDVRYHLNLI